MAQVVLKVDLSPEAMLVLSDLGLTLAAADARYLKLAADNDPLTGTLDTLDLLPTTDDARDIGSAALRYRTIYPSGIQSVKGTGATITRTDGGTLIATVTKAAGATAALTASPASAGYSATVIGAVNVSGTSTGTLRATGLGALVSGTAAATGTGVTTLEAIGTGSLASGYSISSTAASPSLLQAGSFGAVALGMASGAILRATTGFGPVAMGQAVGAGAILEATGNGALARGFAQLGTIVAAAAGAHAGGYSFFSAITAVAAGACAGGFANMEAITAAGDGAFAFGDSTNGLIEALAANSVQFGPGSNAEADTLKVGTAGLRLKGTTGAPGTPVNGDIYMGGAGNAFVIVRANGQNVQLPIGQNYTVNTFTTDRNLSSTGTATLNEVVDVLSTLINDLITAGQLS